MKKPFVVVVTKTVTEEILLEANTPEEAEMLAEDLSVEGQGDVVESIIEAVEALPAEDRPMREPSGGIAEDVFEEEL